MRKAILTALLFSSLSTTAFPQIPDSTYAKWLLAPEIKQGFDYALGAVKLKYEDFTFRTDYWEVDPARTSKINAIMTKPLQLPFKWLELGKQAKEEKANDLVRNMAKEGEVFQQFISRYVKDGKVLWTADRVSMYSFLLQKEYGRLLRGDVEKRLPKEKNLKDAWRVNSSYVSLLAAMNQTKFSTRLDSVAINFAQSNFPSIILEDTADEKLSVDELDSLQKVKEKMTQDFVPIISRLSYPFSDYGDGIYNLFGDIVTALHTLEPFVNSPPKSDRPVPYENKEHQAIIGGRGPNHYKGDYALIIDLGGDDTYELTRRPNFENQIIIDLGGNDKYFALEDYALACGYFGYSVLIDVAGDDLYQGKNFSVGCGFFGCGLLWDQAGNDTYIGDQFTQGAGGFGIGVLKDDGGNDRYQAALMGQGFGFVRGVGALLDGQGSDHYFAGGKYKELLGLAGEVRYQSMSQGCAYGLRPDLSGGLGFLFDYDGDDSYNVDMYGQGSSYWWGLGALVDFKGNDRYIAQQYAQGAGVHMSLGVLVDSSGDDFYLSKGVSQGCGHDLGAGMLFDLYGNDNYVAADGSQAYGSANGFGILVDGAGNDGYYVKDKKTTQGVGNPRREYGSIAIFLDCGGIDHYDGNGGENQIWKPEKTTWGVGVDGNFGANDTLQVKK